MKKLIVLGAGLLLASVITHAQVDTTSAPQRSTPQQSTPQVTPQQQESQNATDPAKTKIDTKNMVRIQAAEVPASLKRTLQAPEYAGWESGTLYKDKSNNHYILQIQDGGKTRTHHFGSDGKPVADH
jgi:hypothetical protein